MDGYFVPGANHPGSHWSLAAAPPQCSSEDSHIIFIQCSSYQYLLESMVLIDADVGMRDFPCQLNPRCVCGSSASFTLFRGGT